MKGATSLYAPSYLVLNSPPKKTRQEVSRRTLINNIIFLGKIKDNFRKLIPSV